MKKQITTGVIATLIVFTQFTAFAQAPTEWDKTQQFLGLWSGQAELNFGGQIFNVTYNTDFIPTADGSGIVMNEWFDDPSLGSFRGANLIGLNATDGLIHWFSIDNFGTAHEHTGSWVNPRRFHMNHESLAGGQTFREDIDFKMRGNNTRIIVELYVTLDDDTVQSITGTLYLQSNGNRNTNASIEKGNTIEVYPNPSSGEVTIESAETIEELIVVNQLGQEILRTSPNENETVLQLKGNGVFIIQIKTTSGITSNRILIGEK